MQYEKRITAYIDILGFKDLLTETIDKNGKQNEKKIDDLIELYKSIREVWDLDSNMIPKNSRVPKNSKRITTFSDCLVISFFPEEKSEIFYTLLEIKLMIMRLIYQGVLCRGAITYGELIHTEKYLFGPALIEAYLLESKAALYPRVILHRDIINKAGMARLSHHSYQDEIEYVESLLEKDTDGMYYIDYFLKAQSELNDPLYDFPKYIERLGNKIRKGLMGSSSIYKADLKVKYRWLKERYNNMIDKVQSKVVISDLRKQGESELADYYESLKKINPND